MFFILLIIVFLLIIVPVIIDLVFCDADGWSIGFFIPSALCLAILLGIFLVNYSKQCDDIGIIITANSYIETQDKNIVELKKLLNDIKDPSNTALNADNPIASIVEQVAAAQNNKLLAQTELLDAKRDIEKRKVGMFSFVINMVGEK